MSDVRSTGVPGNGKTDPQLGAQNQNTQTPNQSSAQNKEEGVGATVRDAAQKLGDQAAEVGGQVYRQAADAGRYATRQIEEQPLAALMTVGILGVIIGFLLGRSSVEEQRSLRDYVDDYMPRKYWR